MDSWAEEVLLIAKRLSRQDQLQIAELLVRGTPEGAADGREVLDEEWLAELRRRYDGVKNGTTELLDGPAVMDELRRRHRCG